VLTRYSQYLLLERGLATTTVALNLRLVEPFLAERAKVREGRLDLDRISSAEVNAFVTEQCRRWPRSAKRMVTSLRSFLRFLHVEGTLGQPLAAAVPSPAGWTLAGLPKALPPAQVAALLASCDRCTSTGRRDLAILSLLSRLGMRVGEVAALSLDDIDWRQGEVTVRGKGNRHDVLPLPTDVGSAVVDYLTEGRPTEAQGRTVFVRAQAPYRALTPGGVISVVATAGRRCGLGRVAAHRLRHSVATTTLREGGSLAEIGQLLRHVRPATTSIYAKVDVEALGGLARPWPGGES
jgi:integrase/recombinase XerD